MNLTVDAEKLGKIWAVAERGATEGERQAAFERAAAMIAPAGYPPELTKWVVAVVEAERAATPGHSTFLGARLLSLSDPTHVALSNAQENLRREKYRFENADRIAAVLSRYGSEEAVFALSADEQALRSGVGKLYRRVEFKRGGWTERLDGKDSHQPPTDRAKKAVMRALTAPQNIPEAIAEYERWDRLWDDRNVVSLNEQAEFLSIEADVRRSIIATMIEKELTARSLSDVLARLRFCEESEGLYECTAAVVRDLTQLRERIQQFA